MVFYTAVGYAKHKGLFVRNEMVCAKTLCNYLHKGVLGIKAIDLPLVVQRSQQKSISRKHKREFGKSIELRNPNIEMREDFENWELDTVRGAKDKTALVFITLLEHKSRLYVALRCLSARSTDVKETLHAWLNTFKDINLACLCKIITADNGLEFAEISDLENETLSIYFARPYSAWERESNERHNGLLRRCIPKGIPIKTVSKETIQRTLQWCNNLLRKILNYRTPWMSFLEKLIKL